MLTGRMILFIALLAVTPAFAACLDDLPFNRSDPDEAAMGTLFSVARDDAKAWSSRAILTSATTFEGKFDGITKENLTLPQDPALGNGRSVFWAFDFGDPETGAERTVIVAAHNRSIILTDSDDAHEKGDTNGLSWGVESDTAAARAHADARFADALKNVSDPGFMIILSLEEDELENDSETMIPVWTIMGMNSKENQGAYALVNAFTGEVMEAGPWKGWNMGDWGQVFPEKKMLYEDRGGKDLTVTSPSDTVTFPVDAAKATARFNVCYGQNKPAGSVHLSVVNGAGKEVGEAKRQGANGSPGVIAWEARDLPVGEYTSRISLSSGVAVDYRYHVEVYTGSDWSFSVPGYGGPYPGAC